MGNWKASIESLVVPFDRVACGQITVSSAGTAQPLGNYQLRSGIMIKALAGNTGNVYVGGSNVHSGNGFVLDAGEQVFVEVSNLSNIWIDVDTNDDGVSYIGG